MSNPNQFTTLPNDMCKNELLGIAEVTVYLMCKKYMNASTREAYPSYATLAKDCSCARNKVIQCIKNLEETGYVEIRKKLNRKSNFYYFPKDKEKQFQKIAYKFLLNEKLTGKEKGYLAILQQHFRVDKDAKTGEVSISNIDIQQLTKVSPTSL